MNPEGEAMKRKQTSHGRNRQDRPSEAGMALLAAAILVAGLVTRIVIWLKPWLLSL